MWIEQTRINGDKVTMNVHRIVAFYWVVDHLVVHMDSGGSDGDLVLHLSVGYEQFREQVKNETERRGLRSV